MRETGGGTGWGSHRVLRPGHGRHRVRRAAAAVLPRWLRRSGGRGRGQSVLESELLDDPRADPIAVGRELRDIARLNALFGGTKAVVDALEAVFRAARDARGGMGDARWTLLDMGRGAGDIPRAAVAAAARHGITLTPIGVEVIPAAARLAQRSGVAVVIADGNAPPLAPKSVDVVTVSQVLHHPSRTAAVRRIRARDRVARGGGGVAAPPPSPR